MRGRSGGSAGLGLTTVVAAAALGLAGCGGSDAATAGATLPPISTPTSAATQSPSPDPSHLTKKQELAAAEATVRRYFLVLNALDRTMDADKLAALLTGDCKCRELVRSTRSYAAKDDHYIQRGRIERIGGDAAGGSAQVLVTYSATAGGVRTPTGEVINRTPPVSHAEIVFYLVHAGAKWLVSNIQELR